MIFPALKSLTSPDVCEPELPHDPECCGLLVEAGIGPSQSEGAETFAFIVTTPTFLALHPSASWGRGTMVLPSFSWTEVRRLLDRALAASARPTWAEVARELGRFMDWEFDGLRG